MDALEWARALEAGDLPSGCATFSGRWRWPATPLLGGGAGELLVNGSGSGAGSGSGSGSGAALVRVRIALERLRAGLSEELAPSDPLGISRALLLNESAGHGAPAMLRRLGFVHLLSASGIHLYALALLLLLLLKRVLGRLGCSPRPAVLFSRLAAVALWLFCWALAGLRPGMLRPLLLVALRESSELLGFRWRSVTPLLAALAIDLAAGLSRGEVSARGLGYGLAVVGGMAGLRAAAGLGKSGLRTQLALAAGSWTFVALLEAWQSSTIALATPALSLVTLPPLAVVGYPLLVGAAAARALGFDGASRSLAAAAAAGITTGTAWLARAAMSLATLWAVPRAPLLLGAALAAPAAAAVAGALGRRRGWAVGAAVVAACVLRLALAPGEVRPRLDSSAHLGFGPGAARELRQLAVGQGDAALVVDARGQAGLIDAGSEHAVGDSRWIGLLARSGVTRLDWVALTHLDEDHAGGLRALLRLLPVVCAETARAQWEQPRGESLARALAEAGASPRDWDSGCVPYPALAPPEPPPARALHESHANEAMGAVWVPLPGGGSYLSPGDATAHDEPRIGLWARSLSERWELASRQRGKRILKVSHHGSKTSSAPEFLDELKPDELWISVGRGNLYGHPSAEVLERLQTLHKPIRRTDLEGELKPPASEKKSPAVHEKDVSGNPGSVVAQEKADRAGDVAALAHAPEREGRAALLVELLHLGGGVVVGVVQRSPDDPRADAVDRDVVLAHLLRERASELDHRRLRNGVREREVVRQNARGRRNVHDPSAGIRASHRLGRGLDDEERRLQVHHHGVVPRLLGRVVDAAERINAGVVHQAVHVGVDGDEPLHRLLDRRGIAQVALKDGDQIALRIESLLRVFELCAVA
jgi:beta-lactamase superfamily II metal-dependent hydrolase